MIDKARRLPHLLLTLMSAFMLTAWEPTAQAQSQKAPVSMSLKAVPVKTVLDQLKKQTGLNFIYSTDLAKTWPKVSINVRGVSPRRVLDLLMGEINCTYDLEGNLVTITRRMAGARVRMVSGIVTDDQGEPLTGVSICIDDSKVCTITDSQGFFTLKVPAKQCNLIFSYLGMEKSVQRLAAGNGPERCNVRMKGDNSLTEVVVTGYQEISKPKMTGSVTTLTADKLDDRYTSNLVSNLEGRVAGLSTYGGTLKIRGTSSLYAETTPLLVVDGLPMEGRIADLNQYDIQSINVLKDAAATAIYGARASNGVIVITTKNANKKGKVDIDFTANLTVYNKRNMDYNDNFYMNAAQQVEKESKYFDYLFFGGGSADPIGDFESALQQGTSAISSLKYAYYQLAKGEITKDQLAQVKTRLSQNNFAKDYADAVYRRQVMQEYNLSLRARGDKTQNNLTLNMQTDNQGVINTLSRRLTANYKGSFELAKWLTANVGVNAVFNKNKQMGADYSSMNDSPWNRPAYEDFYNEDGSVKTQYGWYDGNDYYSWQKGISPLGSNAIDEHYNNVVTTHRLHTRFHGELVFRLFDGFSVNTMMVYENDHITADHLYTPDSHPARVIKDAYATYDAASGKVTYPVMETGGIKQTLNTDGNYWTARAQANYDKTFGRHAVNAIAGLEFRETKTTGTNALMLGYDDQLQTATTNTVNFGTLRNIRSSSYFMNGQFYANQFAFEPYIDAGMNPITEVRHRYASGYANVTYTYDDRYNAFASFRKDYADVYGLNAKYRGRPLWSVGGAWNMDHERFLEPIKWVNYLKLRLSYGATGNIYQGATSYLTATTGMLNYYSSLPYAIITSPANPNLSWEKTYSTNIGIDYSFWDNRIRGSLDYYHKRSEDVFSNKSLDPTTGFTSMFVNAASMTNNGIELQLTGEWLRANDKKALGWETSLTLSHNSNKVTDVDNPATRAYELIETPFKKGYPASAIWSYRFAGIDDGTYGAAGTTLWYGDANTIMHGVASSSPDVLVYSGQTDPKIVMGLDNRLRFYGFTLSVMLAYYGGHKMRALPETETFAGTYGPIASYFLNSWTPDNHTSTPGWGQYSSTSIGKEPAYSDISVRKADFIKIRNIVLGYTFPQEWLSPIGIRRASLEFQVNNPCFLWRANKVKVDPETLYSNRGVSLPASYVFTLNVNL
jgi:TonB-linked SusC/RagA family outer membrane protein